jgi:hypothetical protein
MKYQVTAQSTDQVVMAFEAEDMFDAAEIAGDKLGADIYVKSAAQGYVQFEGDDYYTLSLA